MYGPSLHLTEGHEPIEPGVGEASQTSPSFPCWRLLASPDALQGQDTSIRNEQSKGQIVHGAQHPRTFGRGHIDPASIFSVHLSIIGIRCIGRLLVTGFLKGKVWNPNSERWCVVYGEKGSFQLKSWLFWLTPIKALFKFVLGNWS